jgi:hypothetical protein
MAKFYNTTGLSENEHRKQQRLIQVQEDKILALMRACITASPWELWVLYNKIISGHRFGHPFNECVSRMRRWTDFHWNTTMSETRDIVPITSIRRAMTNLTDAGFLEKTDHKRKGPKGKAEYIWKVKSNIHG